MVGGARAPGVALFCATFLEPEMLHIHRHVTGLKAFRPVVVTQKLKGDWEAPYVGVVKRSPFRFAARAGEKLTGKPWQIGGAEVRGVGEIMDREGCGLLHIFFGSAAVHLLPLMRRHCTVVSFHGSDVAGTMTSAGYGGAVREMFERARLVPCRSDGLAERVRALGCPEEKIRIMRTVLPEIGFVERVFPADGAWRIVQAARLVPKKGIATALRAFAVFGKSFPEATFTVAGEGPLEGELKRLAEELGVASRVLFPGFLSQGDLMNLYARSHVFMHPSEVADGDTEGVPNAMLEAMATGLPVVATEHGGIPEAIENGVGGILCAERDAGGLAEALLGVTKDEGIYREFSRAASERVRERFSSERGIAAIEGMYREALG